MVYSTRKEAHVNYKGIVMQIMLVILIPVDQQPDMCLILAQEQFLGIVKGNQQYHY